MTLLLRQLDLLKLTVRVPGILKDETGGPYVSVGVNPGACAPKQSSLEGCVDVSVIKAAGRKPSDDPNFWNKMAKI